MKIRLVLGLVCMLFSLLETTHAAIILRVETVAPQAGAGNVLVGVFATSDANVQLGGYDMPVNFGGAGPTALPTGITYLGATNTIFTSGSTLTSLADPQSLVDFIVSDAPGVATYPQLLSGIESKLFDLRFNVGPGAVVASTFSIALSGTHDFFQLNDNIAAPIPASGFTAGALTINAIPEPSSLLIFGFAPIVAVSLCRYRLRA